jgi:uncharacterized membrane protein YhiD involved in acid resistance
VDELMRDLERFKDQTSAFTLTDIAIVLVSSLVLSWAIGLVYRSTHRGTSYSQSFAQTLVMVGIVTAVIMLVIGSNIARAFALVGALSVIRFRNAVKETRDVGFMFFVMAIGMALGTRFYLLAALATSFIAAALIAMHRIDAFAKEVTERLLRVRLSAEKDAEATLEPVFRAQVEDARLIAVETVAGGVLQEVVYSVVLKPGIEPRTFLDAIRAVTDNNKVSLVVGQQEVDL